MSGYYEHQAWDGPDPLTAPPEAIRYFSFPQQLSYRPSASPLLGSQPEVKREIPDVDALNSPSSTSSSLQIELESTQTAVGWSQSAQGILPSMKKIRIQNARAISKLANVVGRSHLKSEPIMKSKDYPTRVLVAAKKTILDLMTHEEKSGLSLNPHPKEKNKLKVVMIQLGCIMPVACYDDEKYDTRNKMDGLITAIGDWILHLRQRKIKQSSSKAKDRSVEEAFQNDADADKGARCETQIKITKTASQKKPERRLNRTKKKSATKVSSTEDEQSTSEYGQMAQSDRRDKRKRVNLVGSDDEGSGSYMLRQKRMRSSPFPTRKGKDTDATDVNFGGLLQASPQHSTMTAHGSFLDQVFDKTENEKSQLAAENQRLRKILQALGISSINLSIALSRMERGQAMEEIFPAISKAKTAANAGLSLSRP